MELGFLLFSKKILILFMGICQFVHPQSVFTYSAFAAIKAVLQACLSCFNVGNKGIYNSVVMAAGSLEENKTWP